MAKKVENKKVIITFEQYTAKGIQEVQTETNYFELIYGACKRPSNPQSGYSWDDIEKINRVKDYYEQSKGVDVVSIEDADVDFIVERVKTNTWNTFDKNLLDFKKYIDSINK